MKAALGEHALAARGELDAALAPARRRVGLDGERDARPGRCASTASSARPSEESSAGGASASASTRPSAQASRAQASGPGRRVQRRRVAGERVRPARDERPGCGPRARRRRRGRRCRSARGGPGTRARRPCAGRALRQPQAEVGVLVVGRRVDVVEAAGLRNASRATSRQAAGPKSTARGKPPPDRRAAQAVAVLEHGAVAPEQAPAHCTVVPSSSSTQGTAAPTSSAERAASGANQPGSTSASVFRKHSSGALAAARALVAGRGRSRG